MTRRVCSADGWPSCVPLLCLVVAVCGLFGGFAASNASAQETERPPRVTFLRPDPGTPVFDTVDIEVDIEVEIGEDPELDDGASEGSSVEKVELRFDGAIVGRKTEPPWRWTLDVGSHNRDRVFYVDIFLESGLTYRAEHYAPRFEADEEIDLGLRQLYVTVTDKKGQRVLDLEQDDFTVIDDGEVQSLVTFEGGAVPFTAVLLVDGSQSVQRQALNVVLQGARRFVESLRVHDEVKILFFGDRVSGSTRWSGPDDDVGARIDSLADELQVLGGSAIFDHLYLALLRAETRQGRRVVIALTDGWDLHSVLRPEQLEEAARRSQAQIFIIRRGTVDVQWLHRRYSIAVPASSLQSTQETRRSFLSLEEIAEATGGRILDIDGVDEVEGALQEILAELREQYALGYYPSNQRGDGSWHQVEIRVEGEGADVRSRGIYVDE